MYVTVFEVDKKIGRLEKLQRETLSDKFWEDDLRAQDTTREISELREIIYKINNLEEKIENAQLAIELLNDEEDKSLMIELTENLDDIENSLDKLEESMLLNGRYDSYPAVMTIHPGAGGTESQDWAEMLFRMYRRWIENKEFSYIINDYQAGEEAGIKNVTFTVKGRNAYGLLKSEKGIHRLVRISPFDSSKRRHTSFVSVDVVPLLDKDIDIKINKEDLKIETFKSSSAGGQHVNVTDSAVRITHIPTGIVVQCQNERSQMLNRQTAMQILKSRLFELEREKDMDEINKVRGEKKEIGWGSQIRSYVLQPYQLIKDHRTGVEIGDVQSVLDGDLDLLIRSFLEKNYYKK
ncbi:MAG: peptide chain release factor 2 [Candidatus Humimicrobiaceae bacterium]|nr:peptide chain release factor 2 [Candidatus Humimicrobiaceae bacterium]